MKDTVFRGRGSLLCPARARTETDQVAIEDKQLSSAWRFNIPQDKHDPIILTNTARKDAALPTIKYVIEQDTKPVYLARTRADLMARRTRSSPGHQQLRVPKRCLASLHS